MSTYLVGQNDPNAASPEYNPRQGPGGVFARWLQGQTPKYAKNDGSGRGDFFRDTMARIAIRVTPADRVLFESSVSDGHARQRLLPRLAGNVGHSIGYMDFLLQGMSMAFREKIQIAETLGDNYVLYTFGQAAPTITFQGVLINTVQDDQAQNFLRLYLELLRATQLARRQKAASIEVDSYIFTGVMTDLNLSLGAQMEVMVPFSFSFLVKKIAFTNYTVGWTPNRVGTAFSTDPNAVPIDVRFARERAATAVTLATPPDTVREASTAAEEQVTTDPTPVSEGGDGTTEEDPRVQLTPPTSGGAAGPTGTPQTVRETSQIVGPRVLDRPETQRPTTSAQVQTPSANAQGGRTRSTAGSSPRVFGPRLLPAPEQGPPPPPIPPLLRRPETEQHSFERALY